MGSAKEEPKAVTRAEEMVVELRAFATSSENGKLLSEAADVMENILKLQDSMMKLFVQEGNWRIPLSDGVRAEVTVYGNASAAHVKAFAKTFAAIAEGYLAPAADVEGPKE